MVTKVMIMVGQRIWKKPLINLERLLGQKSLITNMFQAASCRLGINIKMEISKI